jgi:PAS domain S-box-containing protein
MGRSEEAPPSERSPSESATAGLAPSAVGQELFSLVFASITDALIVTDEDGRLVLFNQAAERLLGRRMVDVGACLYDRLIEVLSSDDRSALPLERDPVRSALRGIEVRDAEYFVRTSAAPDGLYVLLSSRPLRDARARITGALLVTRDVTAGRRAQRVLEQANEQLRRTQEQRAELSALLVHDLKSPLQSIIMNTRYLIGSSSRTDGERDCLKDVLSAADMMHRMVLDLLDLSISEDTELKPQRTEIDVLALVEEVREAMALRALDQRQRIVTSVLLDIGGVRADRELIFRVLQNLVDNCIKYGPVGGTIGIEARAVDGGIEFRVHDEGPGIPEAQRSRIFEKYTRVDPDTSARRAGSRGLGLRFCWVAVQAHGGRIWVEDQEPHGACFCVHIPNG